MNINAIMLYFHSVIFLPIVKSEMPGTFFWRPRVTIELEDPVTKPSGTLLQRIQRGQVVLIEAYSLAISLVAFTTGVNKGMLFEHHSPFTAAYHNNVYRWALRYLDGIPDWVGLKAGHFSHTHRVWKNRYHHMDAFVPKWLRPLFFYVDDDDWKKQEELHRRYKKYAEHAFSPHYTFSYVPKSNSSSLESLDTSEYSFNG